MMIAPQVDGGWPHDIVGSVRRCRSARRPDERCGEPEREFDGRRLCRLDVSGVFRRESRLVTNVTRSRPADHRRWHLITAAGVGISTEERRDHHEGNGEITTQ